MKGFYQLMRVLAYLTKQSNESMLEPGGIPYYRGLGLVAARAIIISKMEEWVQPIKEPSA